MHKVSRARFRRQVLLWLIILIVLVGSFPLYNHLQNRPLLDSSELSMFDIAQTTAIIFLFYVVNYQRRQIEHAERTTRDLHQELSIILASRQDINKKGEYR